MQTYLFLNTVLIRLQSHSVFGVFLRLVFVEPALVFLALSLHYGIIKKPLLERPQTPQVSAPLPPPPLSSQAFYLCIHNIYNTRVTRLRM